MIRTLILKFSRKHEKLYTACYCISFVLLLFAGAFLEYGVKSFLYPIVYERQEVVGIIEDVRVEEKKFVQKHFRTTSYHKYYFDLGEFEVPVTNNDYYAYEVGDSYACYLYEKDGDVVADYRKYTLWKGIFILALEATIFTIAFFFITTETSEKELERIEQEKKDSMPPKKINYTNYSTKELYEMCIEKDIKIMHGKRNNRRYLQNCLMSEYQGAEYVYKWRKKDKKIGKVLRGIAWVCVVVEVVNLMRQIYYIVW